MVHRPRIKPYIGFFIVAVIAFTCMCYLPLAEAHALNGRHLPMRLSLLIVDAITIFAPYWLLPRRTRWTTLIPLWLIALWFTGCIWYYRFWGDFPDITTLFFVSNLNAELFNSIAGLWHWRDAAILLFPAIVTTCYFLNRKAIEQETLSAKKRITAIILSVVCFAAGQVTYSVVMRRYFNQQKVAFDMQQATYMRLVNTNSVQTHSIRINGIVAHYIASAIYAYETLTVTRSLSEDEKNQILTFLSDSEFPVALSDSLQSINSGKNIVLIVVESLNASVINASCNGRPVAPTLLALSSSDSVFAALDVETQTRFGGSGDGQLLANTGLYPLPRFSTSLLLGSKNTFPGLPRLLGRKENIAIFADSNQSWNEKETFVNFGFSKVLSNLDYKTTLRQLGSDAAMFQIADSILPTLRQPFMLELLTTSMHIPFDDPEIPSSMIPAWITRPDGSVGPTEKYYRMVNYFDSALARFIENLKIRGLYDNTIIFIVSDHAQNVVTGYRLPDESMVFMALNTGIGEKIDRRVGQVDVFPTILQLAGAGNSVIWKGAGTSMLGPAKTEQQTDFAKKISELILRSDFFKEKICTE